MFLSLLLFHSFVKSSDCRHCLLPNANWDIRIHLKAVPWSTPQFQSYCEIYKSKITTCWEHGCLVYHLPEPCRSTLNILEQRADLDWCTQLKIGHTLHNDVLLFDITSPTLNYKFAGAYKVPELLQKKNSFGECAQPLVDIIAYLFIRTEKHWPRTSRTQFANFWLHS